MIDLDVMNTQNIITTSNPQGTDNLICNPLILKNSSGNTTEIEILTNFYETLSQIDQRLKNEDQDYKNKYYPD